MIRRAGSGDIAAEIVFDPEANPGLMLPYAFLDETLEASQKFNDDIRPQQGQYLLREFYDFADAVKQIPGYRGVFGTGHPFYALQPNNSVTAIPEISRFIGETRDLAARDSTNYAGKWACGACQVQNVLPDLKTACKPCELVVLKPRDVFKALPDLDFWLIVKDNDPEIEAMVEARTNQAGFYQSDKSVYRAVRDTYQVLKSLEREEKPASRLPIDLHIVTETTFKDCLDQVELLKNDSESYDIPIRPRSLHVNWEATDEAYNFTHDFLFSFTEYDLADNLQAQVMSTRRNLARKFTNGQIFHKIFDNDPKAARQLTNSTMMKILADRISQWREV